MLKNTIIAGVLVGLLSGCVSMAETRRDARFTHDSAHSSAEALLRDRYRAQPVTGPIVTDVPYVDVRPLERATRYPASFNRTVTMNELAGISMLELASRVEQMFGVRMVYEAELGGSAPRAGAPRINAGGGGLPPLEGAIDAVLGAAPVAAAPSNVPSAGVPLSFNGTAVELFNTVGSAIGSHWEYNEGTRVVHFYRFKTETFRLPAVQGTAQRGTSMGGQTQSSGGGSGGQPISQAETTGSHQTDAQVWDEMATTLEQLVSEEGRFSISQTAGTVTVRDRPDRLETIRAYIQQTADALARQVDIDVTVYRVVINDTDSRAINWNLAFRNMLGEYLVNADTTAGRPDVISGGLSSLVISVPEENAAGQPNRWGNSSAILDTLSSMGRASVVTSTSIQTANNQPAPMKIVRRHAYLESVAQNMTGSGTDLTSTGPTLTPGVVETGLNIFALPHVMDDGKRMLLKMMVSLSSLESMDSYGNEQAMIQLPQIASREFERQVWLNSGETLVLAGFEQTDSAEDTASPIDRRWWALGGNSRAHKGREFVVIAIHPTVTAVRSRI